MERCVMYCIGALDWCIVWCIAWCIVWCIVLVHCIGALRRPPW